MSFETRTDRFLNTYHTLLVPAAHVNAMLPIVHRKPCQRRLKIRQFFLHLLPHVKNIAVSCGTNNLWPSRQQTDGINVSTAIRPTTLDINQDTYLDATIPGIFDIDSTHYGTLLLAH